MPSASSADSTIGAHKSTQCLPGVDKATGAHVIAEFTNVKHELGRFYHLAVVRRPGNDTLSSNVSLFIAGERVGLSPISWPKTPGLQRRSSCFGSMPSQLSSSMGSSYPHKNKRPISNCQSRLGTPTVTLTVTVPTMLMINGEAAPCSSPGAQWRSSAPRLRDFQPEMLDHRIEDSERTSTAMTLLRRM